GDSISVLRNQLGTIREQVEALESKLRDVELQLEAAKFRSQGLEVKIQNQEVSSKPDELEEEAKQILKLAFASDGKVYIEQAAQQFGMSKSMADYHSDFLQ